MKKMKQFLHKISHISRKKIFLFAIALAMFFCAIGFHANHANAAFNEQIPNQEGGLYFGRSRISENQLALNSSSFGATWTARTSAGARNWHSVSLSSDGKYQTAVAYAGHIYTSSDYGATWAQRTGAGARNWSSVSLSSDGKYQTAGDWGGYIYTSFDYGATWAQRTGAGARNWHSVSLSSDGKYQTAGVANGYIYTSSADSYIDTGNLGIGTNMPESKLQVYVSSSVSALIVYLRLAMIMVFLLMAGM